MKGIVDSICNTFQIPHIMAHWTYDPIGYHYSSGRKRKRRDLSVNVYPDSDVLSAALADLIRDYDWTSYTILYDTADSKLDQWFFTFICEFYYQIFISWMLKAQMNNETKSYLF